MAGQHGHQTRRVRLVALLAFVCLAAGLVRRVTLFPRSPPFEPSWTARSRNPVQPDLNPDIPTPPLHRIHGRWEAVRASLGLPPLSHSVVFSPGLDSASEPMPAPSDKRASRFDLGRKRRADEAARQPFRLHFAHDARPAQPGETLTDALACHDKERKTSPSTDSAN